MQLQLSSEQIHVRDEVRAFLSERADGAAELPRRLDDRIQALREWQARCHAAGFVGRSWPVAFGGRGVARASGDDAVGTDASRRDGGFAGTWSHPETGVREEAGRQRCPRVRSPRDA